MANNNHKVNQTNPNNPAYQKMLDNRSQQLDPKNPKYNGGKSK